jgi:hypothetical protein
MFKVVGLLCVALVVLPFRDGDSVSSAAKNEVVEQIPYSLDILAARHPLAIGLVRSALNDNGAVDRFVESYAREEMDRERSPGLLQSYAIYYYVMFDKDEVRTEIANAIEKTFGLDSGAPAQQ